jgi:type IV secretory pathway VirB2 component (pilin)
MSLISLSAADGSGSLVAAALWIQDLLVGTLASTVAVIAVATIGLGMLAGRVDIKRGMTVILGCFILFGASSIVAGMQSMSSGDPVAPPDYVPPGVMPTPVPTPRSPPPPSSQYDPYAGASVPPN